MRSRDQAAQAIHEVQVKEPAARQRQENQQHYLDQQRESSGTYRGRRATATAGGVAAAVAAPEAVGFSGDEA